MYYQFSTPMERGKKAEIKNAMSLKYVFSTRGLLSTYVHTCIASLKEF
jgi:hypothetical protein